MLTGLVMQLVQGAHRSRGVKLFALGGAHTHAELVMALGVLVLAATPAFRVLALLVLWSRERDWRFVGVAAAVVVTLSVAVVIGHG